jgi:hypothetical protein
MTVNGMLALGDLAGKPDRIDDRGMIQLIRNDDVFGAEQGGTDRLVGRPA